MKPGVEMAVLLAVMIAGALGFAAIGVPLGLAVAVIVGFAVLAVLVVLVL